MSGLQEMLSCLRELESSIGEYYKACSERWPRLEDFWLFLHGQELLHAEYVEQISRMVSLRPKNFMLGRPVNPAAVRTIRSGILDNITRIRRDRLYLIQALAIAVDLEQSALEQRLTDIVKSEDFEFEFLAKKITAQTERHRALVREELQKHTTRADDPSDGKSLTSGPRLNKSKRVNQPIRRGAAGGG